jgi:hypothetical protein
VVAAEIWPGVCGVRGAASETAVQGAPVSGAAMNYDDWKTNEPDPFADDERPLEPDDSYEPPDRVPDEQLSAEDFADHMADWQRNLK